MKTCRGMKVRGHLHAVVTLSLELQVLLYTVDGRLGVAKSPAFAGN